MFQVTKDWNPKQTLLKDIILKKDRLSETKMLLQEMHSLVHSSPVYGTQPVTYMDEIWDGLNDLAFRTMPTIKDVTVAWNIWHITRIEDLTVNILIQDANQVLNDHWLSRLGTRVMDTANAMTDDVIIRFSNEINKSALYEYRNAVGIQTKTVIESLSFNDLKRRFAPNQLTRIHDEGGVIDHADSIWLLDFWGKKNVAGIFQMPVTRHQIVHLNDCAKLKHKCLKIK
jgi:hypothetical protein